MPVFYGIYNISLNICVEISTQGIIITPLIFDISLVEKYMVK